jgi:type IV pilus biogenesis protein CpaD/CtpE
VSFGTVRGVTGANNAYVLLDGASSVLLIPIAAEIATPGSLVGRRVVVLGDGPESWIVVASYRG